jgi:hypothetical protein
MVRAWQRRFLIAFADALLPASARVPGANETQAAARLDRYTDGLAPGAKLAWPFMLLAIELFPLGLGPIPRPFSLLSREARTRVLERLERHRSYPLRGAFMGVKLLTLIIHAEDEQVASLSGWGRPH